MITVQRTLASSFLLTLVACSSEQESLGTTRQAITTTTFEAEGLFLGVPALTDPAASGGRFIRGTQTGLMAHTDFTSSTPAVSGSVRVRVTQCRSAPTLEVHIDGINRAPTAPITQTTWTALPLDVANVGAGSHNLRIGRIGDAPCNLDVDVVTLTFEDPPPPPPPLVVEAEGASGPVATETDPTASGDQLLAVPAGMSGTKSFTSAASYSAGTIRVRGEQCGAGPAIYVTVDGAPRLQLTPLPQSSWLEIPLVDAMLPAGPHAVAIRNTATSSCIVRVDKLAFTAP